MECQLHPHLCLSQVPDLGGDQTTAVIQEHKEAVTTQVSLVHGWPAGVQVLQSTGSTREQLQEEVKAETLTAARLLPRAHTSLTAQVLQGAGGQLHDKHGDVAMVIPHRAHHLHHVGVLEAEQRSGLTLHRCQLLHMVGVPSHHAPDVGGVVHMSMSVWNFCEEGPGVGGGGWE